MNQAILFEKIKKTLEIKAAKKSIDDLSPLNSNTFLCHHKSDILQNHRY